MNFLNKLKEKESLTNVPQITPPPGVATLDWELTAVRLKDPVTGYDFTNAEIRVKKNYSFS